MNNKPQFNVTEYLQIILRRKNWFVFPMIIIFISFFLSGFVLPRIFEARAVILVEDKKMVNPLLQNLAVSTSVGDRINALREEILSWPRLFQLVEKLGLNDDIRDPIKLERLIHDIRENIKLSMKSRDVVVISYQSENAQDTQNLVNTLCDILISQNITSQIEDTESAIDFINTQLEIYKEKLNQSESELRKFREIYGMGTLSDKRTIKIVENGGEVLTDNETPAGVTLADINRELADAESDLVMASIDCTDKHPRVVSLKRKISSLKEKRELYIKGVAEKVGVEADNYVAIADSMPRQQEELIRLTRDKSINEKIYQMLLERLESAKITENLDNSDNRTKFRIIEPARLPLVPIKPNKLKMNIMGLLLGGGIGVGFVYLVEYTDSSFKNEEQLHEHFQEPVLGAVSKITTEEDMALTKKGSKKIWIMIGIGIAVLIVVTLIVKVL
ncbi:MAG: hypothetical protein JXD21_06120 [Candidatus Omnitrophica bacterium]|nr:hypothetical protein [Candidatus Omnitrophota bacterium]